MKPTYKELEAQNKALRRAISPLEDPIFTSEVEARLKDYDVPIRTLRGDEYYVVAPADFWKETFGGLPNRREVAELGRSLQALLWERTAINGERVFVKRVNDGKVE
jgi:hypothetical protein